MKQFIITVFLSLCIPLIGNSQNSKLLNLDFEQHQNNYPTNWKDFGKPYYKIYTDSTSAISGNYSIVIENNETNSDFRALAIELPDNYNGKRISLSGYIKTENVTDGYAGLWMRIDPQIAFDNMNDNGISGTKDWKKYEITLPLDPENTDKIVFGGLLVGKGKMWIDNLQVSIDGKNLDSKKLKIYQKNFLPAELDKKFDSGSNIVFADLNSEKLNNLELLGKVWGFLKYHHPEIAKGSYNLDYELFRILPDYINVSNNQERDKLLNNWIEKYGTISKCKKCKSTTEDAVLKPNLSWIENYNLNESVKESIKEIYKNRNQGYNYYISLYDRVGNPDFTNENSYSDMKFPDDGFRLLALFRYWNMIEYFFPNKHLTDKKWDSVLTEYIPKFINAKNELEYELTVLQVIAEVNDTHANLSNGGDKISELRGNKFAPFRADFVENKYVVTDYYNSELSLKTNIKIGDIITHIDERTVQSIVDSLKAYYPSSNKSAMLRDMSSDLLRSTKSEIKLNFKSEDESKQQEIVLYDKEKLDMYNWYKINEDEKCYKILEGNIGYITLANIEEDDIPKIKESFRDTKGIIIDIRNYPSTFVPFSLGSYFMTEPTSFVKFTQGNPDNPGEFTYVKGSKIGSDNTKYKGKLVILVNENSQSQAEYTAMAFHAVRNSKIIGSQTAGADGNISRISLPGGLSTVISGIGVYYPNGEETQRIGIVPDIMVKPTIEGIKNGKDEILEKAIQTINE